MTATSPEIYYDNDADLGIGRQMTCAIKSGAVSIDPTTMNSAEIACIVRNYARLDGSGKPIFGNAGGVSCVTSSVGIARCVADETSSASCASSACSSPRSAFSHWGRNSRAWR